MPPIAKASDKRLTDFRRKLDALLLDLALAVVKDGEGAAETDPRRCERARNRTRRRKRIALSIANSPLVKTAIAGNDANWGRVVMAVGKAGEAADRDKLKISFGGHVVAEKGAARRPNMTRRPRPRRCRAAKSKSRSIWALAKAWRGFGPAI